MDDELRFVTQTPLLADLAAQLGRCRRLRDWAILRAQQGLYLTRTSHIAHALLIPDEIRTRVAHTTGGERESDGEVFAWLWLLEAVIDYFRTAQTTRAVALLARTRAVAAIVHAPGLAELAAAWQAQMLYAGGQFERMGEALRASHFDDAQRLDTACRAWLVVGTAWQDVGDTPRAYPALARARELAADIGDRASIMATMANRAMSMLYRMWADWFFEDVPMADILMMGMELRSALAYERATRTESLPHQSAIQAARSAIMYGDYQRAAQLLARRSPLPAREQNSVTRTLAITRDWLQTVALGQPMASPPWADYEADIARMTPDDAAVSWQMLAQMYPREDGQISQRYAERALVARAEFQAHMRRLHQVLMQMPQPGP